MRLHDERWREMMKNGENPLGVARAREIAVEAHKDQEYDVGEPYIVHLDEVVAVLDEHHIYNPVWKVAAMLHDIVEDTPTTVEEIKAYYGEDVSDIVDRVTNQPGANRAERHAATYPRIRESDEAILVKLCNRIANMRRAKKLSMYLKEYPAFRKALWKEPTGDRVSNRVHALWATLDRLVLMKMATGIF